jgi:AraC-like DNA-binding protein
MSSPQTGKCTKSTPLAFSAYAATRYAQRTHGEGVNSWVYRYENAEPLRKRWVACGLEIAVHFSGTWRHAWPRERARELLPGEILRGSLGQSYVHEHFGAGAPGLQTGFVVFGETLAALEREAGGELQLPADAGRVDRELVDLAAAMALGQAAIDPRAAVLDYVRRHADVVSTPVTRAKQELEHYYLSDLPIAMVAEAGGTSATAFTRRFAATYGVTPATYRVMLRTNAASRMLWMRPELSTDDIGEACGFRNRSYFFRTFRRSFGLTPAQARQRFLSA